MMMALRLHPDLAQSAASVASHTIEVDCGSRSNSERGRRCDQNPYHSPHHSPHLSLCFVLSHVLYVHRTVTLPYNIIMGHFKSSLFLVFVWLVITLFRWPSSKFKIVGKTLNSCHLPRNGHLYWPSISILLMTQGYLNSHIENRLGPMAGACMFGLCRTQDIA